MPAKRSKPDAAGDAEEAFPRGGASVLTPLEERKLKLQAKADFERESAAAASEPPKKKKKGQLCEDRASNDVEGDVFKSAATAGKLPKFVELLRFTNLEVGAKIWGVVLEVTAKRLVVALPHSLRGYVAPEDSNDVLRSLLAPKSKKDKQLRNTLRGPAPSMTDLFYPGQFVRAVVKSLQSDGDAGASTDKKGRKKKVAKKVHMSLCLEDVCEGMDRSSFVVGAMVPAVVTTVEDHGLSLRLGVPGVSAFLRSDTYQAVFGRDAKAAPGFLLSVVVKERLRDGSDLIVDCDAAAVASAASREFTGISMGTLLPGQLVTVTVRNVLSDGLLVSFLKYFHGTIDVFHMPLDRVANWRATFKPNQRLQARIIYVDATTKQVRLSLLKHLISYTLPDVLPALGDTYEDATVVRADNSVGLLLRLPTEPKPSLGYVHISNITDSSSKVVAALVRRYPPGATVAAKVIGFRPMDGVATMTMKQEALTGSDQVTWASVQAAQILEGMVHSIEDFGVIVQLGCSVRGLLPMAHISEAAAPKKVKSRFTVGTKLRVRVMNVNAKERKVTLTLKKGLIESKLPPIVDAALVRPGARSHGWVTGITDKGIFVEFYANIKGLVTPSEVPLPPGTTLQDTYTVGQVLRCTVIGTDSSKGLRLSLSKGAATAAAVAEDPLGGLSVGSVIKGAVVSRVIASDADPERAAAVFVKLTTASGNGKVTARLAAEHLADHAHAAEALARSLEEGSVLPKVLLLDHKPQTNLVVVTCKSAMVAAAESGTLPSRLEDLSVGQLAPGFVASVTKDACYVRFCGPLTGRAGLPQVADAFVTDASLHFKQGQTVMAAVTDIDASKGRFSVSLKPSVTCKPSAGLLASYFRDVRLAADLAGASSEEPQVGSVVSVTATEQKEYGLVCEIQGHDDLVGLVVPAQLPPKTPSPGHDLKAVVLDVHQLDGIVDLSARAAFVQLFESSLSQQKAALGKLETGHSVQGVIELVKLDAMYLVVSLPQHGHALAFVPSADYNAQAQSMLQAFKPGQRITATVARLPTTDAPRLLLHMSLVQATPTVSNRKVKADAGVIVAGKVKAVHAMHADVTVGRRNGRLHVTEVDDLDVASTSQVGSRPLAGIKEGQNIKAVVLGHPSASGAKQHRLLELSTRPAAIAAASTANPTAPMYTWSGIQKGASAIGVIQEVAPDHLYVSLSPAVRGRVHILQASEEPSSLQKAKASFEVGAVVRVTVVAVDAVHQQLDLSMLEHPRFAMLSKGGPDPKAGEMVMAQVKAVSGRGAFCSLANGSGASAALTALHDVFVPNALQGLKKGFYVRGRVVSSEDGKIQLSLTQASGGKHAGHGQPEDGPATPAAGEPVKVKKGDVVHGYVKSAQAAGSKGAGVYVTLSTSQEARIQLSRLADHYVDDPVAAFPPGKHVTARVLEVSGSRLELTLKSNQLSGSKWQTLSALEVGQVVMGRVKRVEKYGAFVDIADSMLTGLAHISELADTFLKDPADKFTAGDAVRAVVLRKDEAKGQLSLGLKPSYFGGADGSKRRGGDGDGLNSDDADEGSVAMDDHDDDAGDAVDGDAEGAAAGVDLEAAMAAAFDESDDSDESDDDDEDDDEAAASDDIAAAESEEEGSDDVMVTDERPGSAGLNDLVEAEDDDEDDDDDADSDEEDGESDGDDVEVEGTDAMVDDDDDSDEKERAMSGRATSTSAAAADVAAWPGLILGDDAEPDAAEGAAAEAPTHSKGSKKRAREAQEAAIRRAELARVNDVAPESKDDFERLVLGSPNSSYVWIRYMAFLLQMADVEEARRVAERALGTIDLREQNEKFNVWLAYLNLENTYAEDPESAAGALLKRAVQYNDAKKMYLAAIDVFERSQRDALLKACTKAVRRKFGESCKVWLRLYALELKRRADASMLLVSATQALPRRKHVKFLSKAALLELKEGSVDRGRALFENLLQSYPKRTDLWGMYIDQEIKCGNQQSIRNLLERTIHLDLPAKKMRYFFKRYVDYESTHGTEDRVAYVKQRALEYIEAQQ